MMSAKPAPTMVPRCASLTQRRLVNILQFVIRDSFIEELRVNKLWPAGARVDENGELWLGGCAASQLAQTYRTPLYVFDERTLRARARAYQAALKQHYPGSSQIAYASKAYLSLAIAQLFDEEGLDLDVVSGGELSVALAAGFPPERIHFHGNNKSPAELALALTVGGAATDEDRHATGVEPSGGPMREREQPAEASTPERGSLARECEQPAEASIPKRSSLAREREQPAEASTPERATISRAGVGRIVVDNFHELDLLTELADAARNTHHATPNTHHAPRNTHHAPRNTHHAPRITPVWLRLSPGVQAHTHSHIQTGHLDTKFGFPIATGDAERAVARAMQTPGLALVGLHCHIGSQIYETGALAEAAARLVEFAAQMRDRYGFVLQELSPGGGWGVPMTNDDPDAPIEQYVAVLAGAVIAACRAHGLELPRLILEPGRSLVAPAAVALYTVGSRKEIPGVRTYVSVDGGMEDNIRPALYGAEYTALRIADRGLRIAEIRNPKSEIVTIAGKFCESGDILIRDIELPRLEAGDLLAIPMAGAYTLAMASNYNLVPRPAVVLVKDGQARLIQRRETYADLITRDLSLYGNDGTRLTPHASRTTHHALRSTHRAPRSTPHVSGSTRRSVTITSCSIRPIGPRRPARSKSAASATGAAGWVRMGFYGDRPRPITPRQSFSGQMPLLRAAPWLKRIRPTGFEASAGQVDEARNRLKPLVQKNKRPLSGQEGQRIGSPFVSSTPTAASSRRAATGCASSRAICGIAAT